VDNRAGQRDALLLPAGKFIGISSSFVGHAQALQQRGHLSLSLCRQRAIQRPRHRDVVEHRQARHQVERLEDVPQSAASKDCPAAHRSTSTDRSRDADRARGGTIDGAEQVKQRAFTGTAAAEQMRSTGPRGTRSDTSCRAVNSLSPLPYVFCTRSTSAILPMTSAAALARVCVSVGEVVLIVAATL